MIFDHVYCKKKLYKSNNRRIETIKLSSVSFRMSLFLGLPYYTRKGYVYYKRWQ